MRLTPPTKGCLVLWNGSGLCARRYDPRPGGPGIDPAGISGVKRGLG